MGVFGLETKVLPGGEVAPVDKPEPVYASEAPADISVNSEAERKFTEGLLKLEQVFEEGLAKKTRGRDLEHMSLGPQERDEAFFVQVLLEEIRAMKGLYRQLRNLSQVDIGSPIAIRRGGEIIDGQNVKTGFVDSYVGMSHTDMGRDILNMLKEQKLVDAKVGQLEDVSVDLDGITVKFVRLGGDDFPAKVRAFDEKREELEMDRNFDVRPIVMRVEIP